MTAMDILKLQSAYALTVEDYVLLSRSGALNDFAKTELIEGVIVPVNALYTAHACTQRHFFRELDASCGQLVNGLEVLFEVSIRIGPRSMPRPDLVLTSDVPKNGPLQPAAIALVVEICDTTADVDLGPKPRMYADAGIPEYWVADLSHGKVHRMWSPVGQAYTASDKMPFGQPIVSLTIAGLTVATEALLRQ